MTGKNATDQQTGGASPRAHADDIRREAESGQPGLVREFGEFLLHNKKWWLTPIIVILLLFGLLIVLAGSGAAPFIYTLF